MREWLRDWEDTLKIQKGLEDSSVRVMIRRATEFLDYCAAEELNAAEISVVDVENYMKHLFYSKNANVTRAAKLSAVKGFYEHLVYRSAVEVNPAARAITPQVYSKPLQSFNRDDVLAMFSRCDIASPVALRNAVILTLGCFCGLRISEIIALRLCDVLSIDGMIDIAVQPYDDYMPKRGSARTLRFLWKAPSRLVLRLVSLRIACDARAEDLLIVSKSGRKMTESNVDTMLKKLAKAAGLRRVKVTTHMMRATFASSLRYIKGYDEFAIMRACGHRNLSTTARYIADRERITKEYPSLAAYWSGFNKLWEGEI